MEQNFNILLLGQERELLSGRSILKQQGYHVELSRDTLQAGQQLRRQDVNLCLIVGSSRDRQVVQFIRQMSTRYPKLYILFSDIERPNTDNNIALLKAGVDQLVPYPFHMEILTLILARYKTKYRLLQPEPMMTYKVGALHISKRTVHTSSGIFVGELTKKQDLVLSLMTGNLDRIVPWNKIVAYGWKEQSVHSKRSLDVMVVKIRTLLAADSNIALETIRGVGLRLHTL